MSEAKKSKRRQSVRKEKKKDPLVIEMIFPDPVEVDGTSSSAEATGKTAKTGKKKKSERVIFRF